MFDHPLFFLLAVSTLLLAISLLTALHRLRRSRRRHKALMREKEVAYGFVQDMGEAFTEAESAEIAHLLSRVLHYALRTTRGSSAAIYLTNDRAGLKFRYSSGLFPAIQPNFPEQEFLNSSSRSQMLITWLEKNPPPMEGLLAEVALHGRPILIPQANGDPRIPVYASDLLHVDSFLAVPMRFRRNIIGLIAIANSVDSLPFRRTDVNLLQSLADQASVSIHYASLRDQLEEKRRMDRELEVARGIQASLLPKTLPDLPGIEMAAFSRQARKVGGDFYDVIRLDDHHLGIAIADVAGKGVAGAILMAACRSSLRALAPGNHHPEEVLAQLNRVMAEDLTGETYITIAFAVLDLRNMHLHLARAGHEPPLLIQSATGHVTPLSPPGFAVGMCDTEDFTSLIQPQTIPLAPGDTLLFYTDGVPEALDALDSEWGRDTLLQSVSNHSHLSSSDLVHQVKQDVLRFSAEAAQYDDMTMLALKIKPLDSTGPLDHRTGL